MPENDDPAVLHVLAVKLPTFWVAEPELWFSQAEAAFRRSGVTVSSTKYDHVLMKLPENILVAVRDIVRGVNDDSVDPYGQIRTRLLASFGRTKWQLANLLLDSPPIGDRRPSAMMDAMLALLPPGEQAGTLFQALFMRRLPSDMRQQLAARDFPNLTDMAAHADALWDARGPGFSSAAAELAAVLPRSGSPAGRGRSPVRNTDRPPGRRQDTPRRPAVCFNHQRYGDACNNCRKPCAYKQGNGPAAPGL
jgi:hypothetical protein